MINYKQILSVLGSIAYGHNQINSFGFGSLDQITNDVLTRVAPKYTRMYVVPATTEFSEGQIRYNFNVIICDQVNSDLSKLQDIMSDTLMITKDVFTVFYNAYTVASGGFSNIYQPEFGASVIPFVERFETTLAGWTLQLSVVVEEFYNDCILPFTFDFPDVHDTFKSYKEIIVQLKAFCTAHPQIESFGFGDIIDITNDIETNSEPKYTRFYVLPDIVQFNQNYLTIQFIIYVLDIVNATDSNQADILNDTMLIIKDLYTLLEESAYLPEGTLILNPILDAFETKLAGHTISININLPNNYDSCDIPAQYHHYKWEELNKLWEQVGIDWDKI